MSDESYLEAKLKELTPVERETFFATFGEGLNKLVDDSALKAISPRKLAAMYRQEIDEAFGPSGGGRSARLIIRAKYRKLGLNI